MEKIYYLNDPKEYPDLWQKDFSTLPDQLLIFPSWLPRFKHFCEKHEKELSAFIDYPLGNGTLGKKSFESTTSFDLGADQLLVVVTPKLFEQEDFSSLQEELALLEEIKAGRGEMTFAFNFQHLKESQKLDVTDWLKKTSFRHFTLFYENGDIAENDLAIFRFALGNDLKLNLFFANNEEISTELLEKYEINQIYLPYERPKD